MQDNLLETSILSLQLLFSLDAELWDIIGVSFRVSVIAISIATLPAILVGFLLAMGDFKGRWMVIALFNALMAVPTVVVGLTLDLC